MEIKAILNKPYTETERINFIILNNHQLGYEIRETSVALEAWGYMEQEQTEQRETEFKSKFFYVDGYGWYRKEPKGYQSAVESMNVLLNIANITNGIQSGLIIFYQEPDFSKSEECTEDWLVEHQIPMPAMPKEDFLRFYVKFMTAWNNEMHKSL